MAPLISFDEAQAIIATLPPLGQSERVAIADAAGRVLAQDVLARHDAPRHDTSAMDGYTVADGAGQGDTLSVIGTSAAGTGFAGVVGAGEAVRIYTGAAVPAGTSRVVIQENVERNGDTVTLTEPLSEARHIRRKGGDFAAGDVLLPAGTRLTPRAMVALAAADHAEVLVAVRPKVALISTGDELVPPGEADAPDSIPDSVSYGIAALLVEAGAVLVQRSIGGDDLAALTQTAATALAAADLIIVTGGASVGDRDFAKPMFAAHGLELLWEKIAIKPGKPVWLGRARGTLILGLPGNPSSAMVTARLFLLPILARLTGQTAALTWRSLPLAAQLPATGGRETFTRAVEGPNGLTPITNQDSSAQSPLHAATHLIRCPARQGAMAAGSKVQAVVF